MEVRLEHITVRFGQKTVFDDFSLHLAARTHLLVQGPSGSGKTTLLRLLLGFCVPDKGRIHIGGKPLNAQTVWSLRPLLLLDEATSAVDAERKAQMMDYISSLKDKTVIIVAHDPGWRAGQTLDLTSTHS